MSPEAQRIAIAEACGWRNQGRVKGVPALMHRWVRPGDSYVFAPLPDYLNDLNAMHEAEKVLTLPQQGDYTRNLMALCGTKGVWHEGSTTTLNWFWHATAAQRAEAFLKTIGKWQATGGEKK